MERVHADHVSRDSRTRNCRSRQQSWRQGNQVQGRRHGCGRLPGRFLPPLRKLQGRPRELLRERSYIRYNSPDKHTGGVTYGGYSQRVVVDENYVLKVPANLDLAGVAPLLCAGITTYSPLRHWKVSKGQKVGVVGLGGLGHMAVKLANAFGADVTLFTTSAKKKDDAIRLGAKEVVVSKDQAEMEKRARSFDFIIDTVSAEHDINAYVNLLKRDGSIVLVGAPEKALPVAAFPLIMARRSFAGSGIGGIPETQEMLDFCGKHGITADIELIPIQKINEAYERMLRSDVKYRFVIDMATLQ